MLGAADRILPKGLELFPNTEEPGLVVLPNMSPRPDQKTMTEIERGRLP